MLRRRAIGDLQQSGMKNDLYRLERLFGLLVLKVRTR